MKRFSARWPLAASLAATLVLAVPASARAQEAAPSPVVIVDNARATLLFDKVSLAPGEHVEQRLDVSGFSRIGLLASGDSGPNTGRVVVITRFGPPAVPAPNGLALVFNGGTSARRSDHMPILGPSLGVELINRSTQPVEVSLSVYATQ